VDKEGKETVSAQKADRLINTERHLQWVPVSKMRVSPRAQRSHNGPGSRARIAAIRDNFDPDLFGHPITSYAEDTDVYWVVDGAHRYLALLQLGYEDQQVQCWVYTNMCEAEAADKFLRHNDVKTVGGMDKYHVAIVANWQAETDIDRIVRAADLSVGHGVGAIGCVGTLKKTYTEAGPRGLATTLRVIRDAYGAPGFVSKVVEGVGKFVTNYEGAFKEDRAIDRLSNAHGGVNGLLNRAQKIHDQYGVSVAVGVAAATVETYNQGLKGRAKLNGWWSTFNGNNGAEHD
jgi:hypothetical protein